MGIRFFCPNGHKLNVKSFLAGKRGFCPRCGVRLHVPLESTRPASRTARASKNGPSLRESSAPASRVDPPHLASPVGREGESPDADLQEAKRPNGEPEQPQLEEEEYGVVDAGLPELPAASAESGDPLDSAPNAVWYVRPPSGGQYGPATPDVLRTWLEENRVSPDTLVWREGWRDWREAAAVFPQIAPAAGDVDPDPIGPVGAPIARISEGRSSPATRKRSPESSAAVWIAFLVLAVLALAGVLVWVLFHG